MSPKSICSGNQKIQTQNIDDDWIGKPDEDQNRCAHGHYKGCDGYKKKDETNGGTGDGSGGVGWKTLVPSPLSMMISTVMTMAGLWNWFLV
jgi:hypothetical protein